MATTARATPRVFSVAFHLQARRRGVAFIPTQRHADPAIHSQHSNESDTDAAAKAGAVAVEEKKTDYKATIESGDSWVPQKPAPYSPSPKLESTLEPSVEPNFQQKRRLTNAAAARAPPLDDVACVGFDGGPWPDNAEDQRQQQLELEDDKDYFMHHKASPLSEFEMVDTRKPIRRATDGTADSYVAVFSEEQRDTADESLRRAMEIWREAATRGDPDSPHGRVLRALRGEKYW